MVALLAHHHLKAIQLIYLSRCKVKQIATGAVSSISSFTLQKRKKKLARAVVHADNHKSDSDKR